MAMIRYAVLCGVVVVVACGCDLDVGIGARNRPWMAPPLYSKSSFVRTRLMAMIRYVVLCGVVVVVACGSLRVPRRGEGRQLATPEGNATFVLRGFVVVSEEGGSRVSRARCCVGSRIAEVVRGVARNNGQFMHVEGACSS